MYKFVYGFLLVIVLGSSGCSDWLDVQPKTSVPEEDLFADEFGFQDAIWDTMRSIVVKLICLLK